MNPNCAAARENLSALVDNEINDVDRRKLEAHIEGCVSCRDEREAILRTRELVAAAAPARAPRAWINEAIRAAQTTGAATGKARAAPAWRPAIWAGPSIAAALALALVYVALRPSGATLDDEVKMPAPVAPHVETRAKTATESAHDVPTTPQVPLTAPSSAKRDTDRRDAVKEFESHSAAADEPAAMGVALSDIAFPEPRNAPIEGTPSESAAPAAPRSEGLAARLSTLQKVAAGPPRIVRVRVRIDAMSRIVSAASAAAITPREDAEMIARLPGATVRLPGAIHGEPPASLPALERSGALDKKLNLAARPPLREVILEIHLPEGAER